MMPPRFIDSIEINKPSLWSFAESFFYYEGISEKLGWQKYKIKKIDQDVHYLFPSKPKKIGLKEYVKTAFKIIFLLVLFLPLMLVKVYYRKKNHFVIPKVARKPKVSLDTLTLKVLTRPSAPDNSIQEHFKIDTEIVRHFASAKIDENWVLEDALRFFNTKDPKSRNLKVDRVNAFLERHAVVQRIQVTSKTSIEDLAKKIAHLKKEGLDGYKSYKAIRGIIDTMLAKPAYQGQDEFSKKAAKILHDMRNRIFALESNRRYLDLMLYEASKGHLKKADLIAEELAKRTITLAKTDEYSSVGPLIEAGWRRTTGGHRISVELKHCNGTWQFIVAQAGEGIKYHRHGYIRDKNQQPIKMDIKKICPIKIYEVKSEEEAKTLLKKINLYKRGVESFKAENGEEAKDFYNIFKNCLCVNDYTIPLRPGQRMGNCAVRAPQEHFNFICQREDAVEVANDFQNTMEEQIEQNMYPALKAKIGELNPKEPIKPLIATPRQIVLQETSINHILPLNSTDYVIGRMADIALPNQQKYSREQAKIVVENEQYYIVQHPKNSCAVSLKKANGNEQNIGSVRVKLQSGDILKFSNSHEIKVF